MQNAKRDKPVLEQDLGLAFIHTYLTGDVPVTSGRRVVVGSKVLLELEELM